MADAHYGNIDIGATYKISSGVVKTANKIYNKLNSGIEITLVPESIVTPCEDDPSIPKNHFSLMPINEILKQSNNSVIDDISVVICVEPSSTIRRRDGTEVIRHTIKLLNLSRTTIEVMIWGAPSKKEGVQLQQKYYLQETTILAIKNGRVCEYNGKVLSTLSNTHLILNPTILEADKLRTWFDQNVSDTHEPSVKYASLPPPTTRMTISDIRRQEEDMGQHHHCILKETTVRIKIESFCYRACSNQINGNECKKRLIQNEELNWYCSKCETTLIECAYRYIVQIQLEDHTDTLWAIAFDEGATQLLSMPAEMLYKLQFDPDVESDTEEVIKFVLNKQYIFKLTYKKEKYNEEERLKVTITRVEQVDFVAESNILLEQIKEMHDEMGAEE
ncbi:replication protein A 70 kDa DNA-binding subunit A-like [Cryptomeria japonica]|uniref:replication protein A 70 kDa DNA-binding subunit A-like n=1 Tax=Cryptomeria japonica TaxID=3369 RepID=UPI0027D9DD4B|nr:replication protein A 70 kDa DNA-binding subunit A-like [Cryptomeria japonica]